MIDDLEMLDRLYCRRALIRLDTLVERLAERSFPWLPVVVLIACRHPRLWPGVLIILNHRFPVALAWCYLLTGGISVVSIVAFVRPAGGGFVPLALALLMPWIRFAIMRAEWYHRYAWDKQR